MKNVQSAVNCSMSGTVVTMLISEVESTTNIEANTIIYITIAAGHVTGPASVMIRRKKKGAYIMKYVVIVDDNSCLYQSLVLERCPSELFGSKANTGEGNRCPDCWHSAMQLYAEKVPNEK